MEEKKSPLQEFMDTPNITAAQVRSFAEAAGAKPIGDIIAEGLKMVKAEIKKQTINKQCPAIVTVPNATNPIILKAVGDSLKLDGFTVVLRGNEALIYW